MSLRDQANERILVDLEARGLTLSGVIGADENGTLQVIMYDNHGLLTNISEKVKHIKLYRQDDPEYRAMYEMFSISAVKLNEED